jgi:hypothetical protein
MAAWRLADYRVTSRGQESGGVERRATFPESSEETTNHQRCFI